MKKALFFGILFTLAGIVTSPIALGKSSSVLLQEGIYQEETLGNFEQAIDIYQQIIEADKSNRQSVAQALYRQGMCYLKQQDTSNARVSLKKLISKYPEQTDLIDKAMPVLRGLYDYDPATLMPADTLLYIEIGNPGQQIETILNMLKGTPFADPTALMRGPGMPQPEMPQGGMMGPAAFMNEGMMNEFKKVRGYAVGITEFSQNNPPLVMVLYPGESDALKGIITGMLGMFAKPVDPIEGMQVIMIQHEGVTGGMAFDDNVIIISQPFEQLERVIKQYTGASKQPSLATENTTLAKLTKKGRSENALTFWMDSDKLYSAIKDQLPNQMPPQFHMANAFMDFENLDEIAAFAKLSETSFSTNVLLNYKDGHNAIGYNLIRTPNLTDDGFAAVPKDSIAVISMAMSDMDSEFTKQAQTQISRITGLDIGRELFANIEQINLFALNPSKQRDKSFTATKISPAINRLGLSITSSNPKQTRNVLSTILGLGDSVNNPGDFESRKEGKFCIASMPDEKIYCYLDQQGNNTVLSFSQDVAKTSMASINSINVRSGSGPLSESIDTLKDDTSKMVMVHSGGALKHIKSHFIRNTKGGINDKDYVKAFDQLAELLDTTELSITTSESDNTFSLHFGVDNIPLMEKMFPAVTQLQSSLPKNLYQFAETPTPGNGDIIGFADDPKLVWVAGINAVKHKVYLGKDKDQLPLLGETDKPTFGNLPELEKETTYFWRIDEIESDGAVVPGKTWSFSTGGLVGWWELDETDGAFARDRSSRGFNGTLKGDCKWLPENGRLGGAIELDGEGDYIDLGNRSEFNIAHQITVMAWVNTKGPGKGYDPIIANGDRSWRLQRYDTTGKIEFACTGLNVSGTQWGNVISNKEINDGTWHHVAGVYDGSKIYLYIDGIEDVSKPASGQIKPSDYSVYIGGNASTHEADYNFERFWTGLLDDLRIYNYALTPDEIAELVGRAPVLQEN